MHCAGRRNDFVLFREVSEVQFVTRSSLFSVLSFLCLVIETAPDAERGNEESDERVTNPASSTTRKTSDDAGSNKVEGPGIRNTTVQKLYVPFAFLVRPRSTVKLRPAHSTSIRPVLFGAVCVPSSGRQKLWALVQCNVGGKTRTLAFVLSTPPLPFWLKVHTTLVHSCNSVICTWLDVRSKM